LVSELFILFFYFIVTIIIIIINYFHHHHHYYYQFNYSGDDVSAEEHLLKCVEIDPCYVPGLRGAVVLGRKMICFAFLNIFPPNTIYSDYAEFLDQNGRAVRTKTRRKKNQKKMSFKNISKP
jgi:hypothetical protein